MSGDIVLVILVAAIGLILGAIFDRIIGSHHVGTFTINYSDPEKDLCTLKLEKDIDYIDKMHTIELDVKVIGKEIDNGTYSERNAD